jgi:hypothetical protein
MMEHTMDFGDAIRALKTGKRVRRAGWNGKGMWLKLRLGRPIDDMRPYIEMKDAQDMLVPWLASQTDMLAVDWEIVQVDREQG